MKIDATMWEFKTERQFNDRLADLYLGGQNLHKCWMLLTKEQLRLIQSWAAPPMQYESDFGEIRLGVSRQRWELRERRV